MQLTLDGELVPKQEATAKKSKSSRNCALSMRRINYYMQRLDSNFVSLFSHDIVATYLKREPEVPDVPVSAPHRKVSEKQREREDLQKLLADD